MFGLGLLASGIASIITKKVVGAVGLGAIHTVYEVWSWFSDVADTVDCVTVHVECEPESVSRDQLITRISTEAAEELLSMGKLQWQFEKNEDGIYVTSREFAPFTLSRFEVLLSSFPNPMNYLPPLPGLGIDKAKPFEPIAPRPPLPLPISNPQTIMDGLINKRAQHLNHMNSIGGSGSSDYGLRLIDAQIENERKTEQFRYVDPLPLKKSW